MPIVELQHVRKAYDTKIAVADLSFTIEPGSMFGLLGPNGSGKTSSIRMMIGITVPDYLPEERGLYKKMKVMDQLIFLGQLRGLDATTASRRAHDWCDRLGITPSIDKKTEELSKGMQQKIQFISTLLHEPELIIMDEPFSGLDPVNAVLLMDTLVDLRKQGRTILFSTHRMDQVEKICDNICLIHNSHLVLSGSMREIKSRYPVNRVLINFTGDGSFLNHPTIHSAKNYGGHVEIRLRSSGDDGADAQALLADAVRNGARITRFEVMEPTLEEIFIEKVTEGTVGIPAGEKVNA
jgi:ABC-2 type transport system ATP-binding protein